MIKMCLAPLLLLAFALPSAAADAEPEVSAPISVGYYPSWSTTMTPDRIAFRRYTHIVHCFVTADSRGKATGSGNLPSGALTTVAHAAGVMVLLGLGGGGNDAKFSLMVHNPEESQSFVSDVVAMMVQYGYDGLALDWESLDSADKPLLPAFVKSLRGHMKTALPKSILLMAVPSTNYGARWFDGSALASQIDLLNVMTYDLHGPWNHAGFNSPLYPSATDPVDGTQLSFADFIAVWLNKGFSAQQILIGIPCYGRGFAANSWGEIPTAASPYATLSFLDAEALIDQGWRRHWDSAARVPWLEKTNGVGLISYDDADSVREKGAWARQTGLRGYAFWEITQDFRNGDNILAAAASEGWRNGPIPPNPPANP